MKKLLIALASLIIVVIIFSPFASSVRRINVVSAQGGNIVCDATVTTLLLIAVRDYGFTPPIDVSKYNFGQYSAAWQAASNQAATAVAGGATRVSVAITVVAQAGTQVGAAATAVSTALAGLPIGGALATNVAGALGGAVTSVAGANTAVAGASTAVAGTGGAANLISGSIAGEDPVCTALRASLEAFFFGVLQPK